MRKSTSVIVIAGVVCSVAILALMNSESPKYRTFLMQENEREGDFLSWVSRYRRAYETKEEY